MYIAKMADVKTPNYWTFERVSEEAKKYKTRSEFNKKSGGAFCAAKRNKWLDLFEWLKLQSKPRDYWNNYEHVKEEARKYTKCRDFSKKSRTAYQSAKNHGWLDDFTWLEKSRKSPNYWTKERCAEIAMQYSSYSDFILEQKVPSDIIRKNNWTDELCGHMVRVDLSDHPYSYVVYVYLVEETHYAYVGLTNNIQRRHRDHAAPISKQYEDNLYKHCKEHNLDVPEPIIILDNLNADEASNGEREMYYKYKDLGWNMINNEASLGALGASPNRTPWTKTKLIELFEKCNFDIVTFRREEPKAYRYARNNNLLAFLTGDDKFSKKPNLYWTHDRVVEESKKYKSITEFNKANPSAYIAAKRNGWVEELLNWLEPSKSTPRGYWTKERVFEESKKYNSRTDFSKNSNSAYDVARHNGWLDEMTWLVMTKKPCGYWNIKENVFNEARKYNSRSEFNKNCSGAYDSAKMNKWLDEMTWFVRTQKPCGFWQIKENVLEEAYKYTFWKDFRKYAPAAYTSAKENNWLSEITWLKEIRKGPNYWNRETVFEEARKYETKKDFRENAPAAYSMASQNGWFKEMSWLKQAKVDNKYWTRERVFEEARKYKKKSQFMRKSASAYNVALKNKWLAEMDWFE